MRLPKGNHHSLAIPGSQIYLYFFPNKNPLEFNSKRFCALQGRLECMLFSEHLVISNPFLYPRFLFVPSSELPTVRCKLKHDAAFLLHSSHFSPAPDS